MQTLWKTGAKTACTSYFHHFPKHLVSESQAEGNTMERNDKKMGSLFEAFSRAEEKIHEEENGGLTPSPLSDRHALLQVYLNTWNRLNNRLKLQQQ